MKHPIFDGCQPCKIPWFPVDVHSFSHGFPIDVQNQSIETKPGWWLSHPSEKYEFVSWDDDIPNYWGK